LLTAEVSFAILSPKPESGERRQIMQDQVWGSEAIQIDADTCVDVKANSQGVVLGQLGGVWFHDLHISPAQAKQIANALIQGANESLAAN
jgi:hypothetical protein